VHPKEAHLVARLTKDGLWRVAYQEDKDMSPEEVLENQAAHFERILPGHPKASDYSLSNISPYRLHQRSAEKYRVGRVCLAGDAAHLCNPMGGLGLTGGFADVLGLGECLEGIHNGWADESILDRYDDVRRSIFLNVVDPISTKNFLRISDPEAVLGNDPFFTMCENAKTNPELKEKIDKVCYPFFLIVQSAMLNPFIERLCHLP
jgi:2-polyprenyl-6-methoxyphenol hydroxylase-like FAD-dependent oxidoreductase